MVRVTTGYTGVRFDKTKGRWQAQRMLGGKNRSLGYFDSAEEASAAYDASLKKNAPKKPHTGGSHQHVTIVNPFVPSIHAKVQPVLGPANHAWQHLVAQPLRDFADQRARNVQIVEISSNQLVGAFVGAFSSEAFALERVELAKRYLETFCHQEGCEWTHSVVLDVQWWESSLNENCRVTIYNRPVTAWSTA
jgi:hypothetical protein